MDLSLKNRKSGELRPKCHVGPTISVDYIFSHWISSLKLNTEK